MTIKEQQKRIGVVVVAYNAATTLARVLDRIPEEIRQQLEVVLVCDDFSQDKTYEVGLEYQRTSSDMCLEVIRRPCNLGYGGNQKASYEWAITHGLDYVVLLHGDGQYAPENMDVLLRPLLNGECDAVFGSRMLEHGSARRGGMPLYKYVGNHVLTGIQNRVMGTSLSEWHSGYRAYSVDALRSIPFELNSDGFNFDTQIIVQLFEANLRIVEVPIPTRYGNEICYVNGARYARDVVTDVLRYRANRVGFGSANLAFNHTAYSMKTGDDASHVRILSWLGDRPPSKVLDLGCSNGELSVLVRKLGHHVTGVDIAAFEGVEDTVDRFVAADLDTGIPKSAGSGYDIVIAADIMEHVRQPEKLLAEMVSRLAPHGVVIVSIPNFSHWYPRLRVAAGRFDYDRRGILDSTHLRFFTRRSFDRLVHEAGFDVIRHEALGLPLEVFGTSETSETSERKSRTYSFLERANRWSVKMRPNLFAYQLLYELSPQPKASG